jgi:transcriptional regulator with XRE-family HTH domain
MESRGKISIRQLKAARALLGWSQEDLASATGISIATIRRLEAKDGPLGGRTETVEKLRRTLENAGIVFIFSLRSSAGMGVAYKTPSDAVFEQKYLTGPQMRAARALIGWTAEELSRNSTVSLRTIQRAELISGRTSMTEPNELAIRRAFQSAGVEFIDENGGGPGVRLRK